MGPVDAAGEPADGGNPDAPLERLAPRADELHAAFVALDAHAKAVLPPKEQPPMRMQDKLKALAARARAVPAKIEGKADELFVRLDGVEKRGEGAFDRMHGVLTDVEAGVSAAEDAVNQLTNSAPDA